MPRRSKFIILSCRQINHRSAHSYIHGSGCFIIDVRSDLHHPVHKHCRATSHILYADSRRRWQRTSPTGYHPTRKCRPFRRVTSLALEIYATTSADMWPPHTSTADGDPALSIFMVAERRLRGHEVT